MHDQARLTDHLNLVNRLFRLQFGCQPLRARKWIYTSILEV